MASLSSIDKWQLRRLCILADMLDAIMRSFREAVENPDDVGFKEYITKLIEFRQFYEDALDGESTDITGLIPGWLEKLEDAEGEMISRMFSTLGDNAIEVIHASCRDEGQRWGRIAAETKGEASTDARRALLVLNEYLVDGMPSDDNIEVVSSESRQITYNLHHCHYSDRFGDSLMLAWLLCSARQAWKDGFFQAIGGIAHQMVTAKCQGDDACMNIITLID
jgi:hypothetical protein